MRRSSPSPVVKIVGIPSCSIGLIIGKSGRNIKRLQSMPGIQSFKMNSATLTVEVTGDSMEAVVTGDSMEAVEAVLVEIRKLAITSIRLKDFVPDFIFLCYQAEDFSAPFSIRLERVRVNEEAISLISPAYRPIRGEKEVHLWYPGDSFAPQRRLKITSSGAASNSAQFTSKTIKDKMSPTDYSNLISKCFYAISASATKGTVVRLEVKLGKTLFLCEAGDQEHDVSLPSDYIDAMLNKNYGWGQKFCASHTTQDIAKLVSYLNGAGYTKLPPRHKVTLHLVDFKLLNNHSVSLRLNRNQAANALNSTGYFNDAPPILCTYNDSSSTETSDHAALEWPRVLKLPQIRGFIVNLHAGRLADLRLSISTRKLETAPNEELLAWVEDAWVSRTEQGLLHFNSEGHFHISEVRYKEVHKFIRGADCLVTVAKIGEAPYKNDEYSYKWEVALKSLWVKNHFVNKDDVKVANMEKVIDHIQKLFDEGNRIVEAMGELHLV